MRARRAWLSAIADRARIDPRKAIAALKADGHTPTIRALLWHQGESNSKDSAEVYQAKLEKFIARHPEYA